MFESQSELAKFLHLDYISTSKPAESKSIKLPQELHIEIL